MNSCAVSVKAKMITATMPGSASGTTMRANAPARLWPSTIACSSTSRGIAFMKPVSSHTDTGIVIVG